MSDEQHRFTVTATWNRASKEGSATSPDGSLELTHGAATSLGGKGGVTNPEELLTASVSTCFLQTWAIFLEKLKLPIDHPTLEGEATVEKDPAGGFRVSRIELRPHVPKSLRESRGTDVEKTLSLAEKYCIVSKAVRGSVALTVSPKET